MDKDISSYFNEKLICFFQADSAEDAIKQLVHKAYEAGKIQDEDLFFSKIKEREKIVSTGIGLSVAFPHAKLPDLNKFFIVLGVLQKGIDWKALDGQPVKIIFLIGGPTNKQTEYLEILSNLTTLIKDETLRKKMLTMNSPQAMMKLFA